MEFAVELSAGILLIRIVAGRCFEGHEIAARALEIQIQCLDVEVLEFSQRGVGGQLQLQPADGFSANDQNDIIECGLQCGLEILAIASGSNRELRGHGGRGEVGASQRLPSQRLPVGGFQPVDR